MEQALSTFSEYGVLGAVCIALAIFAYRLWRENTRIQERRIEDKGKMIDRYHEGMTELKRVVETVLASRGEG